MNGSKSIYKKRFRIYDQSQTQKKKERSMSFEDILARATLSRR